MRGYVRFYCVNQYHTLLVLANSGGVTSMMDTGNGLAMSLHGTTDGGFESTVYDDGLPIDDGRIFAGSVDEAAELAFNIGGD
ncbi:MAG: hypothetical protein ACT6FC_03905, partial [Methanosarcinaceae archaeon]